MKIFLSLWRGTWLPSLVLAGIVLLPYSGLSASDPSITTQPQSQTNGPGTDVAFTVGASGPGTLTYQWSFYGTNLANSAHIGGATSSTLTISNAVFGDAGTYQVLVSNGHGSVTSSNAVLGVQRVVAWGYNDHGQSTVPIETSNAVAVAGADSSVMLRPDGTLFAWGNTSYTPTNPPATLSNVVSIVTDGGQWGMLAILGNGSVATWDATPRPPADLSNVLDVAGSDINTRTHGLALKNDGTLVEWDVYGYITNGVAAGLSNIVSVAAGVQHFLAIRADGTVVSWGGNTYGETNVPVGLNQVVQVAGGYGWSLALQSNGDLVGWGTDYYNILATAAYVHNVYQIACPAISALALFNDGSISAWGNNVWGGLNVPSGINSAMAIGPDYLHGMAILGGRNAPQIYQQPLGLTALAEQSVLFKASAVGNVPLRYQWQCNGTNIAGATSATLLLTNLQPSQAGQYAVVITNAFGKGVSSNALLEFTPVGISSQPQSQTNSSGTIASFLVSAAGPGPLTYQWMFNGANLAGATNSALDLNNVQIQQSGFYSVVITDSYGSVTSSIVALTVEERPPIITTQPQDQTVFIGKTLVLRTEVAGSLPATYQWQLNGVDVAGATNPILTVSNVTTKQAGAYRLVVSNSFGTDQSTIAKVDVPEVITWGDSLETNMPPGLKSIWRIGAGYNASWAFHTDDTVTAWGPTAGYVPSNSLPDFVEFVGGNGFNLGLRKDGKVQHWGLNNSGVGNVPPDLTNCVSIAAGIQNGMAVRSDGTVAVWGYSYYGATNVPLNATNVVAVFPGSYQCYALRSNGTLVAWGRNDYGECDVPAGLSNVVSVAGGGLGGAALKSDGTVIGWGYLTNYLPSAITNMVAISAGFFDLTVLKNDGTASVFGPNAFNATNPPSGLTNVVAIGSGYYFETVLMAEPQPVFAHQPTGTVAPEGGRAQFYAPALGRQPLNYQWRFNGGNLPSANSSWLRLENVQASNYGDYSVIVSNSFGAITSAVARLDVPVPPAIVSQPQNTAVAVGNTASFTVSATGSPPLTIRWLRNGSPLSDDGRITGTATATLVISNAQPADAQSYSVIVSSDYGAVTSSAATLTLMYPPQVGLQPQSQLVALGRTITLTTSVASGTPPFSYQWQLNGVALTDDEHVAGSTNNTLSVTNALLSDAGNYWLVITNLAGATTSSVASVSVLIPPAIIVQPASQTLMHGSSVTFSTGVSGDGPLSYQWYFNGAPMADGTQISGATTTNLTLLDLHATNAGSYVLVVTNLVGSAASSAAELTVLSPPVVIAQPVDQDVVAGSNVIITAAFLGTEPISNQWFLNGAALTNDGHITRALSSALAIDNAKTNDSGSYYIVATNIYGAVTSSVAVLTVWLPVNVTLSPSNQTSSVGSSLTLTASAEGSGPFGYQWYFNSTLLTDGGRISGSATKALNISNAQTANTGDYYVVVTNLLTVATSSVTTVTILVPPSVTTQPTGRSTPLGLSAFVSAYASGSSPLTYQWRLNGGDIPNATNNVYALSAVSMNDLGAYQFVVSNAVGVAVSSNAWLTVGPIGAWGQNYYNQCIAPPWLTNVTSFGCATYASYCSLVSLADGSVAAWGSVGSSTNASFTNVVSLSASSGGVLAIQAAGDVVGSGWINPISFKVFPSNIVAVAAGAGHGLALRAEGTIVGWGGNPNMPGSSIAAKDPGGLTKVTAIAAGYQHSMALRSDGTVVAWGTGAAINVPFGLSNVVAIAAGYVHSLALKSDGTVVAWGSGLGTNVPAGLSNIVAIAAGGYPYQYGWSFAVRSNGTVVAWGDNYNNLLNLPFGLSNVVSVSVGNYHALALVNDGTPQFLQQPAGGTAWSGSDWTLRAKAVGAAPLHYQWLRNGSVLDGETNASLLMPAIQSGSAGNYQVVVSNLLGVIASVPVPLAVADSAPFFLTSPAQTNRPYVGSRFVLSAVAGGSGSMDYRWQLNGADIAGATDTDLVFDSIGWTNGGDYRVIAHNSFGSITSSIAKLYPVSVVAWGQGLNYATTNVPLNLPNAIAIAVNANFGMALRADGTVTNWGSSPYMSPGTSNVVEIAVGNYGHGLKKNGTIQSWNVSPVFSNAAASVPNIVSIEADTQGATLLKADGSIARILYNSGLNAFPQLTNVVALSRFNSGFSAIRADGTVFSYATATQDIPPPAWATSNVLDIALDSSYGAVLRRDGVIRTWGNYLSFTGKTNFPNMTAVCANAGVNPDGSVTPWLWTSSNPALTNVPYGLMNVGALDGASSLTVALLVNQKFPTTLLPDALDTAALVVSSHGSPRWFGQFQTSHDGVSAAQSAQIGNNTASSMRMWVEGPVTVSFWWKVSSAGNHGILSFSAGGILLTNISGEVDWQPCTVDVPAGNKILQWTYTKDGESASGQDAGWVDQLQLIPQPPTIVSQPVDQSVVGPTNVTLNVGVSGTPPLTYNWRKDGNVVTAPNSSALVLLNAVRTNSGVYWLIITNVAGSMTSSNAVLDVRVPQWLGSPVLAPDGKLIFNSADASGGLLTPANLANFEAQASTNLVDWVTLPDALNLTNGLLQLQDDDAVNHPARYYRIIEH
ncbi:MAG TPA: immunoglobulin domain-containing protein [bacterium]|nr:immunoglobulin domain-containing protein [bacterium]